MTDKDKIIGCGSCKHYEQGKSCSYCDNPKQTDKDAKQYMHWCDRCDLYEEGIHKTRVEYMKDPSKFMKAL